MTFPNLCASPHFLNKHPYNIQLLFRKSCIILGNSLNIHVFKAQLKVLKAMENFSELITTWHFMVYFDVAYIYPLNITFSVKLASIYTKLAAFSSKMHVEEKKNQLIHVMFRVYGSRTVFQCVSKAVSLLIYIDRIFDSSLLLYALCSVIWCFGWCKCSAWC